MFMQMYGSFLEWNREHGAALTSSYVVKFLQP